MGTHLKHPFPISHAAALFALVVLGGCMSSTVNPPKLYGPPPGPIYYDGNVLKVGTSRAEMHAYFGAPSSTSKTVAGNMMDNYAFYADGTKFTGATPTPPSVTGTSVVRNPRVAHTTGMLTVYHVVYGSDGNVQSVTISPPGVAVSGSLAHPPSAPR